MSNETEPKTPKVVVDGVEMVPKEWIERWRKLSSERGGEIIQLGNELAKLKRTLHSRYGDLDAMAERAQAWVEVCEALNEHRPGWNLLNLPSTGRDCAVKSIRDMAEEIKTLRKKDEEISKLEGMNHRQAESLRWDQQVIGDLRKRIEELESQRCNNPERCESGPNATSFLASLTACINLHSQENASSTPDYILAQFLDSCLEAWNTGVQQREALK